MKLVGWRVTSFLLCSFLWFTILPVFARKCFCATGVQKCVNRRITALSPMGIDEKKNISQLTIMGTYINTLPLKEYVNLETLTLMDNNFLWCDRVQLRYGIQVKGDCEFLSRGLTSQESMDTNTPVSITNNKKTAKKIQSSVPPTTSCHFDLSTWMDTTADMSLKFNTRAETRLSLSSNTTTTNSVLPDYSTHVENIITTEGLAYSSIGLTPKNVTAPASKAKSGFTLNYLEQDNTAFT